MWLIALAILLMSVSVTIAVVQKRPATACRKGRAGSEVIEDKDLGAAYGQVLQCD